MRKPQFRHDIVEIAPEPRKPLGKLAQVDLAAPNSQRGTYRECQCEQQGPTALRAHGRIILADERRSVLVVEAVEMTFQGTFPAHMSVGGWWTDELGDGGGRQ